MGLMAGIGAQLRKPEGLGGWVIGRLLYWHHNALTKWSVGLAEVQPTERALDIGCGGGMAVRQIAEKAHQGFVSGIEVSEVMVRLATQYNARLIAEGRVEITHGEVSTLPYEDESFDKVWAIESFYFWPDHGANLKEILRVMKPGAQLIITMELSKDMPSIERYEKLAEEMACPLFSSAEMKDYATEAGLTEIRTGFEPTKEWLFLTARK